ncbi:MAG TPA: ATP-binding protein [Acidobacteriota bacterium]|nr:ATP-binding protein [Acidobacteriota bacterium]
MFDFRLSTTAVEPLLKEAEEGFLLLLPSGRILEANPACCRMSGYDREDLVGSDLIELVPPADRSTLRRKLERASNSGSARMETVFSRPHQPPLQAELSLFYSRSEEGRICCFLRDLSSLRKATPKHRSRLESLGILAGGIAHDFNNLLSVMMGYSNLVLDDLPAGGRNAERLSEVLQAGARAHELVEQMLTFSGSNRLQRRPLVLRESLRECLRSLAEELPENVRLETRLPELDARVSADPAELAEILRQLLRNSVKAMNGDGGVLQVSLSEAEGDCLGLLAEDRNEYMGPFVKFTVGDSGHGIDAGLTKHVFDPFFTTREVGQGTGLGLSVVHGIVRSLGGVITLESEPGQGTTFEVYLPRLIRDERGHDYQPSRSLTHGVPWPSPSQNLRRS